MGGKKNTKGGKGHKKGKRQTENAKQRELEFKDEDQEYAQITKMLGEGRALATCITGKEMLCHIRGKFRKRVWMNVGDIVLLGLRGFEDGKADIILKYTPDEARMLKAYGELPDSIVIGGNGVNEKGDEPDDGLNFGSDDENIENVDDEAPIARVKTHEDSDGEKSAEPIDWDAKLADL